MISSSGKKHKLDDGETPPRKSLSRAFLEQHSRDVFLYFSILPADCRHHLCRFLRRFLGIQQIYADMSTHWPALFACADVQMETRPGDFAPQLHWSVWIHINFSAQLPGFTNLSVIHAYGETEEETEDEAVSAMWKYLWNEGKNFPMCANEGCNVCACLSGVKKEKLEALIWDLKQRIAGLNAEVRALQTQLEAEQ